MTANILYVFRCIPIPTDRSVTGAGGQRQQLENGQSADD
jgi:hypothetical protein